MSLPTRMSRPDRPVRNQFGCPFDYVQMDSLVWHIIIVVKRIEKWTTSIRFMYGRRP